MNGCRKPQTFETNPPRRTSKKAQVAETPVDSVDLGITGHEWTQVTRERNDGERREYFEVLSMFRNGYPRTTDIACWWCCHQFGGQPIGIPCSADAHRKQFRVHGCFCSFNCARSFLETRRSEVPGNPNLRLLAYLGNKLSGTSVNYEDFVKTVPRAPDTLTLKQFGGKLSIDEFRASFATGKVYSRVYLPLMPWGMYYDELNTKKTVVINGQRRSLEPRRAPVRDAEDDLLAGLSGKSSDDLELQLLGATRK